MKLFACHLLLTFAALTYHHLHHEHVETAHALHVAGRPRVAAVAR